MISFIEYLAEATTDNNEKIKIVVFREVHEQKILVLVEIVKQVFNEQSNKRNNRRCQIYNC